MEENMNFDGIEWHDGRILSVNVAPKHGKSGGGNNVVVIVTVYRRKETPERMRLKIDFSEVEKATVICDFIELVDNYNFGNISHGYSKGGKTFRIYLADGYVEIIASAVSIAELTDTAEAR